MDEQKISVTLGSPAKVYGKRRPAGTTLAVSPEIAAQLGAAGCLAHPAPRFDTGDTPLGSDFDAAVANATAELLARAEAAEAKAAELEAALAAPNPDTPPAAPKPAGNKA